MIKLLFVLFIICQTSYSQIKQTGFVYDLDYDEYVPFSFTRHYKNIGEVFRTEYYLYDTTGSCTWYMVTALHQKQKSKITVEVREASGGIFSRLCKKTYKYKEPSLLPFGFRGRSTWRPKRAPNELKVKFADPGYENIHVIEVDCTIPGSSFIQFLLLDKQ